MLDDAVVTGAASVITLGANATQAITTVDTLNAGITLKVDASAITTNTNTFTFNGSAESTANGLFIVTGGAGSDTLTGGAGADTLTGGAGDDVFKYPTVAAFAASNAAIDSITGGDGTDSILFTATAATITVIDTTSRIATVEKITTVPNTSAISVTLTAASTGGFTTIDLSGDTDATGTNVISSTGINGISTIIGSAGIDTLTLGVAAPATTITGGAGADTLSNSTVNQVTISDVDGIVITMGAVANTTTVMTGALLATTINGGSGVDAITLAGSVSNVATITGAAGADVFDLGATHTGSVKIAFASTATPVTNLLAEAGSAVGASGTTAPAATTVDTVANFISGTDKIALKVDLADLFTGATGTTKYSAGAQTLHANDFVSGIIIGATSTALAADATNKARFYFDTTSKVLYFDASGDTAISTSGAYTAGAVDDFAVIKTTGINLVASDFFFVA
jgi:hypothetical protein